MSVPHGQQNETSTGSTVTLFVMGPFYLVSRHFIITLQNLPLQGLSAISVNFSIIYIIKTLILLTTFHHLWSLAINASITIQDLLSLWSTVKLYFSQPTLQIVKHDFKHHFSLVTLSLTSRCNHHKRCLLI